MLRKDLGGAWHLYSTDGKFDFKSAQVPGTFFYELEKSGYWGDHDIFYRENNRQGPELASRDFICERTFEVPDNFFGSDRRIYLEADGLDTLATIAINNQKIAHVENMHRRWSFPVTESVKNGDNKISIHFANAVEEASDRQNKRALWQVGTPLKGAMHLRKNFCSFGWDWGPQVPDVGIYRDIRISSYFGARLRELDVRQKHQDGKVFLYVVPKIDSWSEKPKAINLTITTPSGQTEKHPLKANIETEIVIKNAELWWPNGYGSQPLYNLSATLSVGGEEVDQKNLRIGLRNIKLVREKDQWGESFFLSCNEVPIFARGANYIPEDVYITRATPDKTRKLLESTRDANMNCLRVWGGGIYPSKDFFDLCDEFGIMIWQDMMFSCAIYDIHNPDFYSNIEAEARDALERIRHHASLALICGNNEMEWAFEVWNFPHTKENRVEYIKQYEVLLPSVAKETAPDIPYWVASPSSGGHFDNPNDPDRGDVHYWDVWHGRKSYTEFRKHHFRFLSEFGFQSFPNIKTIKSYTKPEDRNIFSPVMEDHQRNESDNGNAKIFHFIADYYRYPKNFENIVYVSQLSQGEALRYAVEHLRQNRGRCMGATYWQLNDNWPVASWSSIDYFGRWKAMHYVAKRVYDPLLLCVREEKTTAKIYLCNEQKHPTHGRLIWRLLTLNGNVLKQGEQGVEIAPLAALCLADLDFSKDLLGTAARSHYLSVVFEDTVGQRNLYTTACFVPYKHLELTTPKLTWEIVDEGSDFVIKIRSEKGFAKFVELDLESGDAVFSDNYFDLDKGQERQVRVSKSSVSHGQLVENLRVRSLIDSF
jgi:beta-mannosidase